MSAMATPPYLRLRSKPVAVAYFILLTPPLLHSTGRDGEGVGVAGRAAGRVRTGDGDIRSRRGSGCGHQGVLLRCRVAHGRSTTGKVSVGVTLYTC